MKNFIIFAILAGLTACTNNPNPDVVNRESSVVSSGDGNFGIVPYGQSPIKSFVFKNSGSTSITGTPVITGSGFDLALQLGCENIEPGKNCLVKVMFNSANKESGNYAASLKVADATVNLSASIDSVPSPNYIFSVNNLLVSDGGLNLGELTGRNIKIMTVKIKNSSPKTGEVSTLTVTNNKFKLFNNACSNVALKPNQSCIAKVIVQGDNSNSQLVNQLSFDGKNSNLEINQSEQVLMGQMISLNDSVTLGDFFDEGSTKIQLLKIENQGSGIGSIESSSLNLPPGYSIGNNNCSNIKPGNTCIVRLVYSSSNLNKGVHTDTLTIGDSDIDLTVNQVSNPNDLQSLNLTVALDIPVDNCSPINFSLKDSENLDYVSSQEMSIISSEILYSESSCNNVDNLIIPAFESSKSLFIKKNMAGAISLVIKVKNKEEIKNIFFYSPLNLLVNKSNMVLGQQAQISVVGGKGPFSTEIISGGGNLNISGIYTADAVGTANFKVTDSLNNTAGASVNIVGILNSNLLSFEKVVNQTQLIQGQNGLPPYTYSKVSGEGSINSSTGLYSAGAVPGSVQLKITDALNQEILVNGQVYSQMNVNPLLKFIVSTETYQISPTGGKTPYSYSKLSGDGNISPSGLFSSLTETTTNVKVSDALGQEQIVTIQVVLPLTSNVSSFEKVVNQSQSIIGQKGLAPYVYSKVSGVGSIDSNTGIYSSGSVEGLVQLKIKDALNQEILVNGQVYSQLSLSPLSVSLIIPQTQTFTASGGKLPYTFSKISGVGNINSVSGLYDSSVSGSAQVKVTDALNQEVSGSIQVYNPLQISAAKNNQIVSTNQSFSATGGATPYVYSIVSGGGTINSSTGLFTAPSSAGPVKVKVTDASNQYSEITIQVVSILTINPTSTSVIVSSNKTFSGVGGLPPYSYSILSGNGNINSTSGVFTAPSSAGTTTVRVTDALNQVADSIVFIAANLVLNAGACNSSIPESVTCTVSSSGGIGTRTYSVDVGTINSSTGDFKGVCVNNLGSSVVTVTDANSNSASITLNYPCVYSSCNQIKAESYGLVSANYWLDLDGLNTGNAPIQVFCDQSQDQGGWALVAKYGNSSSNYYHWFQSGVGTLSLSDSFSSSMEISSIANALAIRASEIKVNYGGVANNYYTINQLTADKNKLWSNTTINAQLGVIGVRPTSGYAASNFAPGQVVRMHFGSYSTYKGSGFSSGLGSNITLDTLSDCTNYCAYRLPGTGAFPTSPSPWPLENSPIITYVKEVYYKYGTSCLDAKTRGLKNQAGNTNSGNYFIDPDGANMGMDPYTVYCDMVGNNSTMNATGGNITYSGNYKIHTFTTLGNSTFTITSGSGPIEILVVGGGGGGGSSAYALGGGGGGGAGGVIYNASFNLSGQTSTTVTIGDGGNGGISGGGTNGSIGSSSSAFGLTALGGGGGGHGATCGAGQTGASGGGAGYCGYGANNNNGGATQGNVGGKVVASPSNSAGGAGGGGAGGAGGSNFPTHNGGIGGAGLTYSISGSAVAYGVGGNGAGSNSALNGTPNTGNGGWGAYANSSAGGKGGSGIVIIKYQYKLP